MKKYLLILVSFFLVITFSQAAVYAVTVDGGWSSYTITAQGETGRLWIDDFTLTKDAWFRISDCCIAGDTYYFGFEIAPIDDALPVAQVYTTTFTAFTSGPFGDSGSLDFYDDAWASAAYSGYELYLNPGLYSFGIQMLADPGGVPAGVGVRVDTAPVPEPSTVFLLGTGMLGLAAICRKKFFK